MERLDIFEFTDYRVFMKAFYDAKKKGPGSFSYRRFSTLAQNASPNFVKLVVDGQRNLTVQNIYLFASAMALLPREHEYFEAMVHFTQETLPEAVDLYRRRMRDLKVDLSYSLKSTATFTSGLAEYWENSETWDLICYAPGKSLAELKALSGGKVPLSAELIQGIIRDAISEEILMEAEDGLIYLVNDRMRLSQRWKSVQSKNYVANQINDALKASQDFYSKRYARFATAIFSVKDLEDLQKKVERLSQTVNQELFIDDKSNPEEEFGIARMSYQIYPTYLTKKDQEELADEKTRNLEYK